MTHGVSQCLTQLCEVTAAVLVLSAPGVAVAHVLSVVFFITSVLTRRGSSWKENEKKNKNKPTNGL